MTQVGGMIKGGKAVSNMPAVPPAEVLDFDRDGGNNHSSAQQQDRRNRSVNTRSFPYDSIRPIWWDDDRLCLLDQRVLPDRVETVACTKAGEVEAAIRNMVVRGAPAIGITAAYGVVLAAREHYRASPLTWKSDMEDDLARLGDARPTAVNLVWALRRMRSRLSAAEGDPEAVLLEEARRIHEADIAGNREIGRLGAALIEGRCDVLTHCNAGALATGGYGTALGVIRSAFTEGKIGSVYADETRPWLQGARLTAWELVQDRIPVNLIADSAATYAMGQGKVRWVIVGADRIAANGDVANKIGTYSLAVSARHHGVGFMVAAPCSTIDMSAPNGTEIPIETRSAEEVLTIGERRLAANGARGWNPVFDVTPADLVDAIVTEKGVVRSPDEKKIAALMAT